MTTTFKNFKLSDSYLGTDFPVWDKKHLKKKYKINIKNLDNGKRSSFIFWTPDTIKKEEELLDAFYCFLSDACNGDMTLDEFYIELCGDGEILTAIKAYKACKKALEKFNRLTEEKIDLYDLINDLSEIAG